MKTIDNIFKRCFTKQLEKDNSLSVFDLFKWKKVNILLRDHKSGRILHDMKNLEFPEHFSQTACDIIATKYFRKKGVPTKSGMEDSFKMIVSRLVNFWIKSLKSENLITNKEQEKIFFDETAYALIDQRFAPNSPQWFNTGLELSYNIKGEPQQTYYYDPQKKEVVESLDSYSRTQASACFILSIDDSLLGPHSISEQYVTETKLFKFGSGTGTNFSNIRAIGEKLSGGGESSGLMSFLKGLDRNAGAIKSGGTTRRAAKMVCLDLDHPEIESFINWKSIEEDKVRALSKMGYDGSFEGEAYNTVSGQNSNNSVKINDEFMNKVMNLHKNENSTILLKGRTDNSVNTEVPVSKLWDMFNEASYKCADPAPLFDDTFNAWHTCPAGEDGDTSKKYNRINSTNPCAEYAFLDDTSCNLASINILKFYDSKTKTFNLEEYLHLIGICQLILEASINLGQFPTKDIARRTHLFRTTGLGICNLASLLMIMCIPYDSKEARAFSSSIIGILTGHSYFISSLMAKKIGAFEKFEINRNHMLKVIRNHCRVSGNLDDNFENLNYTPIKVNHQLLKEMNLENISNSLKNCWGKALEYGEKYGYRNAQVSVIAPTGTISLAMDCAATSIEPFFSHIVYKKLSGGGFLTISNPIIKEALDNLGYTKEEIDDILEYVEKTETVETDGFSYEKIVDGKIEGAPHLKEEHISIFDTANTCGTGVRFIDPPGHVKMVASITPLISGSVSKTVNLPNNSTIDDFKDITILSWKLGVKGISLYRDGSKFAQPLNKNLENVENEEDLENLTYEKLLSFAKSTKSNVIVSKSKRNKPIGIRTGTTHPAEIEDVKIYTTVNRNDRGEICEIYITTDREGTIIMGLLNSLSKSLSIMLQHKVPPTDISRMLRGQKYEPHGFVKKHPYIKQASSISDLISKIIDIELGDFRYCQIKPQDSLDYTNQNDAYVFSDSHRVFNKICSNCSSNKMLKNGTCYVCSDCGSTTGCS